MKEEGEGEGEGEGEEEEKREKTEEEVEGVEKNMASFAATSSKKEPSANCTSTRTCSQSNRSSTSRWRRFRGNPALTAFALM